jgi:hypothetical protein
MKAIVIGASIAGMVAAALTVWNQVTNMQRPLPALFAPAILSRVMRRALTGGPQLSTQQP